MAVVDERDARDMSQLQQDQVSGIIEAASKRQSEAAQHDKSAWVSANAGAGKTRVLVDRVTRLLLAGTPPGRILCLTYTNAAAAEMANRLFERLAEWATASDAVLQSRICALPGIQAAPNDALLDRARNLFAEALETPGGLKIQTIHAFCERLLHRFPLEAGVPAGFSILDDRERAELLGQAVREVLARATEGKSPLAGAFSLVAGLVSEGSLDELVSTMAGHEAFKTCAASGPDGWSAHLADLARGWGISPEDTPATILACFHDHAAKLRDAYQEAARVYAKGPVTDARKVALMTRALAETEPSRHFENLRPVFLKADGEPQKNVITVNNGKAHPEIRAFLEAEQERFYQATIRLKAVQLLAANRALLELGGAVIARFEQLKQNRSRLDYHDLIIRTRNMLSRSADAAWVLYKLDGGIEHVLIDEAQDTSPAQWEIIKCLTEEFFAGEGIADDIRTVFAVGDEKQSIFSFQGADPQKFGEMRDWFARCARENWVNVPLNVSFRSTSAVLEAVDLVFAQAVAREGVSESMNAVLHQPSRSGPGLVEIRPSIAAEADGEEKPFPAPVDIPARRSPELQLADQIAGRIARWLDQGRVLAARQRPVAPGDILILVRKRGIFADAMVRALKRRDIPVAGADRMRLTDQIAVQDLMALGQFTLQPDDDLNLAALLKSPLLECDEDDLFALAAERKASLWRSLAERAGERAVFSTALARLERWREAARHLRPFEFFTRVLDGEGRRAAMIRRLGAEAADPINEFLAQSLGFEQGHVASMQGFLAWINAGDTQIKRDMEHGKNEVRIMTIHGAKGLEANIVFLPDTCQVPRKQDIARLLDLADGADARPPVWVVNKKLSEQLLEGPRERAAKKQDEEYNRLLYVAMTRARDELYIGGFEKKKKPPENCWHSMILSALEPHSKCILDENGAPVAWRFSHQTPPAERERQEARQPAAKVAALPSWAGHGPHHEAQKRAPLSPSRLAAAEFGASHAGEPGVLSPFEGGNTRRFKRGNLIHTLLEFLPALEPEGRAERAMDFLMRPGNDLGPDEAGEIIGEVCAILENPEFAPFFGPHSRGEAPFAARLPGPGDARGAGLVFGQIDRIAILEREVLALDYKTNRPPPERVEDVPEIYLRQMAAYAQALDGMFPGKSVRCALLWTDAPRLMDLPGPLLARFAPGQGHQPR